MQKERERENERVREFFARPHTAESEHVGAIYAGSSPRLAANNINAALRREIHAREQSEHQPSNKYLDASRMPRSESLVHLHARRLNRDINFFFF